MSGNDPLDTLDEPSRIHLRNVAENLQLVADFAYGDVALAVAVPGSEPVVIADARPSTAAAPLAASRVGAKLTASEETEVADALSAGEPVFGGLRRTVRGIKYSTSAYPVAVDGADAVLVKNVGEQVTLAPGTMEVAFMEAAEELIDLLRTGPLTDVRTGEPFATTRRAGDGVMRADSTGRISYASPNAVNIMRLAGVEGLLTGMKASSLPGGGFGVSPVLGTRGAVAIDAEIAERVLRYRSIALPDGALVLVEDLTDARRREAEIKVKEATIREVHHRVKNNLQTIASLLRIQARRSNSDDVRHQLEEATERVASMAVVHDLLAGSDEERIDFAQAAGTIVDMVHRGLVGPESEVAVIVTGSTGLVDAHSATSLALALAELVHNAIEHGFPDGETGRVEVAMRRVPGELVLTVRDSGRGLPHDFDPATSANLGLSIVRTVVEDDLRGTLTYSSARGSLVTVRVPLEDDRKA